MNMPNPVLIASGGMMIFLAVTGVRVSWIRHARTPMPPTMGAMMKRILSTAEIVTVCSGRCGQALTATFDPSGRRRSRAAG
jgi:hypothetical protein